jgi:hypothetical protein
MSTKADMASLIALFKASFPNYNPDVRITGEIFMQTLADIPGDTLKAAALACVAEFGRQFAPSIGEIRQMAVKLNAEAAGIPDAQSAYAEVVAMPSSMERREATDERNEQGAIIINVHILQFSHPFVEQVAALIGWPRTFPTDEPGVDRAQFVKFYEVQLNKQLAMAGRLPALTEYVKAKQGDMAGTLPGVRALTRQLEAAG